MRLALIQPQFAPNLYDLASMLHADRVIWNDLEQWSRKGRTHRAAISGEHGLQWINIPIKTEDKKKAIGEVQIDHSEEWIEPFWNALLHSYSEATWFDFFSDDLEADIQHFSSFKKLVDLNIWFFDRLKHYLEFNIEYQLASNLSDFDPDPDIFMEKTGCHTLFQEHDSRHYQWRSKSALKALTEHPVYSQAGKSFIPGLSLFDLLFNEGKECFRVFEQV